MRKLQSKGMLGGFRRSPEYLEPRGSRRAKSGSPLKSRKFGKQPEEKVEGSKTFKEGPEGSVVFNGPQEMWSDTKTFSNCSHDVRALTHSQGIEEQPHHL